MFLPLYDLSTLLNLFGEDFFGDFFYYSQRLLDLLPDLLDLPSDLSDLPSDLLDLPSDLLDLLDLWSDLSDLLESSDLNS